LAASFAAGCGGKKKESSGALVGWAIAGHPLVGATVEAVDANGKVIATSPSKSLGTGTWYLPLSGPPKSFTVVVSGGLDHGRPFRGQLKNLVRAYDFTEPRAIHVNPATTLEAAYLAKHPDKTDAQAAESVTSFLRIPAPLDLESDLRATDRYFSGAEFVKEAAAAGGVAPFVDKLGRELEAGKTHAFPRAPANQTGLGAAMTPLQTLQSGLSITGTIVGLIRGGQQSSEIAQINQALSTIETGVANLQTDMNTVVTELTSLLKQTGQNGYNGAISKDTNNLVTELHTIYPLYQLLLQTVSASQSKYTYDSYSVDPYGGASWGTAAATPAQIEAAVTAFEKGMQGNEALFDNAGGGGVFGIYSDLVKSGGQTGALEEWSTLAGTSATRFITHATQTRAAYAIAYWLGIESEVLAVDGAYESAMNTDSSGNAITPAPVNMHWSTANKAFTGQAATDAESKCVANSTDANWSTDTGNDVLDELNASHSCFTALPDDTGSGPHYQSVGVYPVMLVDQASGLMWVDGGNGNADYHDGGNFITDASQTEFPDSTAVPSPGWAIPSLSQYETLASLDQGSWDVRNQYSSTLDMLANYAQIPYYQNIAKLAAGGGTQPSDFMLTYWTNDSSDGPPCTAQYFYGSGTKTLCFTGAYDFDNNKAYLMCSFAAQAGGNAGCTNTVDVSLEGPTPESYNYNSNADDSGPYDIRPAFGGTHAKDSADYLLERTVTKGETYGGS
jgi:hypothetical protein